MRRPQVFCPTASDRRLTPFTWPNQSCRRVSSHATGYFSQTLTAASRLMNESFQAPALSFLLHARFPSQCTSTKDSGGRGGAHDGHCSPTASKYLPPFTFPLPALPCHCWEILPCLTPPSYHLPRLPHSRQTTRSASLTDGGAVSPIHPFPCLPAPLFTQKILFPVNGWREEQYMSVCSEILTPQSVFTLFPW